MLFLLPLLAAAGLNAQLNLPPVTLSNSSFSIFNMQTINTGDPTNLTVGTTQTSGYEYISSQAIHMPPAFHAGAVTSSTGKFRARLLNEDLEAMILYPAPDNLNAVPLFSKVEFGVDLTPLNFDGRVNAFLDDVIDPTTDQVNYKPGTAAYTAAYQARTILNPYDPDHISVDAVFFRPGSPNQNPIIRYGFYYRDFENAPCPDGWAQLSTDWEWRIRFAPDEVGTWTGFINVWVDGAMLPQTRSFSFNVVAGTNPGYVTVDNSNNRYLKFSGDGSTYFPVGDVYGWTLSNWGVTGGLNYQPPYGYPGDGYRMFCMDHGEMETYLDKLSGQATGGGGGNATRFVFTTWGLEVEREKLNNYDTRQIEMWEMDRFLEMMEQRGVYSVMCIGASGLLHWDDPTQDLDEAGYSDHWDGHPYADQSVANPYSSIPDNFVFTACKGIAGIDDPRDFFTQQVCKDFYKKQLRYIVSRWGYSTAISMWELLNEADASGAHPNVLGVEELPWNTVPGYAQDIINWHDEMLGYIRNTLHDPHLRTSSLLGSDYHTSPAGNTGNQLWSLPNIDVISGHIYTQHENGIRYESLNYLPSAFAHDKPVFMGEGDPWDFNLSEEASDWENHNRHWASAMSGKCVSGLNWSWGHYSLYERAHSPWNYNDPSSPVFETPFEGEYENNYKAVRTFLDMIDFQNYDYAPGVCTQQISGAASAFETFYLRNTNNMTVYGWTHNRSFNRFTVNQFLNTYYEGSVPYYSTSQVLNLSPASGDLALWKDNDPLNPANGGAYNQDNYVGLFGAGNYNPVYLTNYSIFVENLDAGADYKVDWYWTWGASGGQYAGYTSNTINEPWSTWMSGSTLYFSPPPTGSIGANHYPGDWAFVITKLPPRMAGPVLAPSATLPLTAQPNPSNGIFTLQSSLSEAPATIEVHALDGRLVLREVTTKLDGHALDMTAEAPGVYFVTVKRDGQSNTLKLVKTAP